MNVQDVQVDSAGISMLGSMVVLNVVCKCQNDRSELDLGEYGRLQQSVPWSAQDGVRCLELVRYLPGEDAVKDSVLE